MFAHCSQSIFQNHEILTLTIPVNTRKIKLFGKPKNLIKILVKFCLRGTHCE